MKGQRISSLGHLEGMEEFRMPKKIFTQELEGTKPRGRPTKGWKEEAERHLHTLGVRIWRMLVTDNKNGRLFFDRPKPTASCIAKGRRRNADKFVDETLFYIIHGFPFSDKPLKLSSLLMTGIIGGGGGE